MKWNSVQAKAISYLKAKDIAALKTLAQAAGSAGNALVDVSWDIVYDATEKTLTLDFSIIPKAADSFVECWAAGLGVEDQPIATAIQDSGDNLKLPIQQTAMGMVFIPYSPPGLVTIQFVLTGRVRDASGTDDTFDFEYTKPISP